MANLIFLNLWTPCTQLFGPIFKKYRRMEEKLKELWHKPKKNNCSVSFQSWRIPHCRILIHNSTKGASTSIRGSQTNLLYKVRYFQLSLLLIIIREFSHWFRVPNQESNQISRARAPICISSIRCTSKNYFTPSWGKASSLRRESPSLEACLVKSERSNPISSSHNLKKQINFCKWR